MFQDAFRPRLVVFPSQTDWTALQQLPSTQRETIKASLGPLQWLYAVMPEAALADENINTTEVEMLVQQPSRPPNGSNGNGAEKETSDEKVLQF